MRDGVRIRPATLDDRDAVAQLRAELWPDAPLDEHRAEARDILAGRPPSPLPLTIFVAENDDELVGFAEVGLRSHADGCDPSRPCGYLEGWYVRPKIAGQGVGRALVEQAESWARGHGCLEFASDTWLDNERSQRAHAALGFEVVDRCVNYRKRLDPPPGGSDAPNNLYGPDLARIHHAHFGAVAEAAATEMCRRLTDGGFTAGVVVDLASGGGLLSRTLADAGFDVVGVDTSSDMLRLAHAHVPHARFVRESLWTFEPPPCVAVAAVGEAFCYVTGDEAADLDQLEERFRVIAYRLAPGGLLLFDVAGPGRSGSAGTRRTSWEKERTLLYLDESEDDSARQITRRIDMFIPVGSLYRHTREHQTLHLYPPDEVEAALGRSGFTVERLAGYDDFEFSEGWCGFAATRA